MVRSCMSSRAGSWRCSDWRTLSTFLGNIDRAMYAGIGRVPFVGQARKIGVTVPKGTTADFSAYQVPVAPKRTSVARHVLQQSFQLKEFRLQVLTWAVLEPTVLSWFLIRERFRTLRSWSRKTWGPLCSSSPTPKESKGATSVLRSSC